MTVYALDGIRSIIDKKMKDLNTPSLARALVQVAHGQSPTLSLYPPSSVPPLPPSDKGKGKEVSKPRPLSLQPHSLSAVATQDEPLSPPPLYASQQRSPTRPNSAGPSKPRTVASVPTSPRTLRRPRSMDTVKANGSRRNSATAGYVRRPPSSRSRRSSAYQVGNSSTDSLGEHLLASENGHAEQDDSSEESAQPNTARRFTPRSPKALSDPDPEAPGMTLAQALIAERMAESPTEISTASSLDKVEDPSRSPSKQKTRLSARSASREMDSLAELASFLKEGPPDEGALPKRRRLNGQLEDFDLEVVEEGNSSSTSTDEIPGMRHSSTVDSMTSVNSDVSVTTTILESPTRLSATLSNSISSSDIRLTPRAASTHFESDGLRELANFFRQDPPPSRGMTRTASALSNSSWQTVRSPDPNQSAAENAENIPPSPIPEITSRQRKRWSVLDGLRSGPSTQSNGASTSNLTTQLNASSSIDPLGEFDPSLAGFTRQARSAETVSMAVVDANLRSSTDGSRPSSEASRTSVDTPGLPTQMSQDVKVRPSTPERLEPEARPVDPLGPLNPLSNLSSTTPPADRHPASAHAPLDYVKLARTKGTKLIKAVETKKRTYLAVLCGEVGERIELFTVCSFQTFLSKA